MLSDFLGGASAEASMHQPSPRLAATTARRASANAAPSRSPGSPGVAAVWKRNDIMVEPCRRPALHSRVTCGLLMGPGEVQAAWPNGSGPKCWTPERRPHHRASESGGARERLVLRRITLRLAPLWHHFSPLSGCSNSLAPLRDAPTPATEGNCCR